MFWLGLIASVSFVPGYIGATIPTGWAVLSALIPLALWSEVTLTSLHWVLFAFLAYALASLYWSIDFLTGIWQLWLLSIVALSFYLGSTKPDLPALFKGLAVGLTVSSFVSILQALGYSPVLTWSPGHSSGLLFNSMIQAEVIALTILGLVIFRQWLYIPALLPGLVLSHSRGGALALAVGLLMHYTRRPFLIILLALAAFIAVTWYPSDSDIQRLQIWAAAWSKLSLFGHGPGSFLALWYRTPTALIHPEYVHNDFLQFVFEYGIGAILLFAVLGACATKVKAKEWPVYIAFLFMACFSFPFLSPLTTFIGCVAAGRLAADWDWLWLRSLHRRYGLIPRIQQQGPRLGHIRSKAIPLHPRA